MKISVIIPCYNDGAFLTEAVNSVLACSYPDLELIIVNDGSTDVGTLNILNEYEKQGLIILSHSNSGLAFTRNRGIKHAKGEYILPLDADNKIKRGYIEQSVSILDEGLYDIVYAKPLFFGEDIPDRKFATHNFDADKLFMSNYIDACAVYKKTVWAVVGGYDEKMPSQGNEDWEFWLNSYIHGFKFQFIDAELYEYRITRSSMIAGVSKQKTDAVRNYMINKHIDQYREQFMKLNKYKLFYLNDQRNYIRASVKYLVKFFKSIFTLSKQPTH